MGKNERPRGGLPPQEHSETVAPGSTLQHWPLLRAAHPKPLHTSCTQHPPTCPPTHPPDFVQHRVHILCGQLQPLVLIHHLLNIQDLLQHSHSHINSPGQAGRDESNRAGGRGL